jgi:hypothetical protein
VDWSDQKLERDEGDGVLTVCLKDVDLDEDAWFDG